MGNRIRKICIINITLGIVLLLGLLFFDSRIGGNATNGKIEDGIYYVCNSDEVFTEVSWLVYYSNYSFTCVTLFFIFSGTLSLFYLWKKFCDYMAKLTREGKLL